MFQSSPDLTALIHLPLYFNPDERGVREPVEDERFEATAEEISKHFGGGVLHLHRDGHPMGFWWDKGILARDVLGILEVDIPGSRAARRWLGEYARTVLLSRFRQDAIYIKFVNSSGRLLVTEEHITARPGTRRAWSFLKWPRL